MIYLWYNIALGRYFFGAKTIYLQAQTNYGSQQLLVLDKFTSEGDSLAAKITDRLNSRVNPATGTEA